jgi:hypothetical protein
MSNQQAMANNTATQRDLFLHGAVRGILATLSAAALSIAAVDLLVMAWCFYE